MARDLLVFKGSLQEGFTENIIEGVDNFELTVCLSLTNIHILRQMMILLRRNGATRPSNVIPDSSAATTF